MKEMIALHYLTYGESVFSLIEFSQWMNVKERVRKLVIYDQDIVPVTDKEKMQHRARQTLSKHIYSVLTLVSRE